MWLTTLIMLLSHVIFAQSPQEIFWDPIVPINYEQDLTWTPNASATSGLPVTYESDNPNVAIVIGDFLQIVGVGEANITAIQSGDENWLPAESLFQILSRLF